jgi:hypothetical protein
MAPASRFPLDLAPLEEPGERIDAFVVNVPFLLEIKPGLFKRSNVSLAHLVLSSRPGLLRHLRGFACVRMLLNQGIDPSRLIAFPPTCHAGQCDTPVEGIPL